MIEACYIHIPFCDKICTYCDFAKILSCAFDKKKYLAMLKKEYKIYKNIVDLSAIQTLYFGGGTPSALSVDELIELFEIFSELLQTATEITFEANPESLTKEKLAVLTTYGINRISLGVQTFNEQRLQFLNRTHNKEDIKNSIKLLQENNFLNYNLDLIYALPNQTFADVKTDIEALLELAPKHISTYALIVEPHTQLSFAIDREKIVEQTEDIQVKMYDFISQELLKAGYIQYEFSNWCLPNYQSQHNVKYWQMAEYLGVGLGSHGYYNNVRYANTRSINKYIELLANNTLPIYEQNEQTREQAMEEFMFLGLRLVDGVSTENFSQKFAVEIEQVYGHILHKHLKLGNIEKTKIGYRLSVEALFISNSVLSDFIFDSNLSE